jgi:hypothetical protein
MKIRWAGNMAYMGENRNMAYMGENRNTHSVLNGKTEGKAPFEKSRLRCEANIKMDLYTG